MRAVKLRAGKPAELADVKNTLKALQAEVDGPFDVIPIPDAPGAVLIVNEEHGGDLEYNRPNKRRLSIEKLLAIAAYFNVTVDWLLCRPNAKKYIDEMIGDVERRVRTETFAATKAKIIKFLDGIEEET